MLLSGTSWLMLRAARRAASLASFSTAHPAETISESFRTSEIDPDCHTLDHEGKFYTIDQDVRDTVFKHGGFSRHFLDQLEILNETALMVRRPALEVMHYLRTADYSQPPIRYVLYSKNVGAGMTNSLAHIIHYAWLKKWLIVHCHKPFAWIRTTYPKLMTLSTYNTSRMDQNIEAVAWLQHFKLQNQHLTNQIQLSQTYTWSKRETSEKGEPLTKVIDHGLTRSPHATDCVSVILKEIKRQSGPESFRTLVVVDGVNAFFGDVKFLRPDLTRITIDDLALIRGFKKLLRNDWLNGAVVISADNSADCSLPLPQEERVKVLWPDRNSYVKEKVDVKKPIVKKHACYPKELLGSEGFGLLDPFVPIEVQKYSLKEFTSCYDYYVHMNFIQSDEARSEEGRQELQFLSGLVPMDLMRYCATL